MRKTMRKIRWKAGRCPAVFPAVFTVDPGDWRGLEPDAIDTLDVAAQAKVWRDAVAAASAGRATAIGKGFSR